MKRKAHYPVTHTQNKTFTASSGAQQISIDNAFLGPIPERILIALVKNTAFVGSASTNPYHFQHCHMTNLVLYLLPSTLIKHSIIVVNLDKHYMPGSHCLAVCISDCGYTEYFNLYVLPPYKLEIIAFLQRHSISWIINRHRLQGLTSKVCGHYCCIYTLQRGWGETMKSFVDMFVPVRYICNDKSSALAPRSVSRVPRLRPVGAAAVTAVQIADINEGMFFHDYQSTMSLLVIDFIFLEGRHGELVVKELVAVDSHSNRVLSCVFKRPYSREELPAFNARINLSIDHGCNWNDGDVL